MTVDKQQQEQQRRRVDDTSTKPIENPIDTGDEVWCVFYCNAANWENVWIKPAAQPTTVQVIAKQDRFAQKVVMMCRCDFEGLINHFELVQNGSLNEAALYSEQLDRVCVAPVTRRYPALINRKHALLRHDMHPRHTLLHSSKQRSRSCPKLNFVLIQLIALILSRHPTTITCSASCLTSFAAARTFDSFAVVKNG